MQISDSAKSCPGCGAIIARNDRINLENVVKLAPLLYGLMILCGAIYLDVYYSIFSANIFHYLDLSEILVSFINVIVTMLRLFAILAMLVIIEMYALRSIFGHKSWAKKITVWVFNQYEGKKHFCLFISILLTCLYFYFTANNSIETNIRYYWLVSAAAIFINFIFILLEFKPPGDRAKSGRVNLAAVYVILSFFVSTAWDSVDDAKKMINLAREEKVTLITSDTTIITTPDYYYIGRTNKYIFLYHSTDKHRDVIPVDKIKQITFEKRSK
jgi:hypothetical protein